MNEAVSLARMTSIAGGAELVAALTELGPSDSWVSGTGEVDSVELRVASEAGDEVTALRGRFHLLSLAGPRGGPFAVTLARKTDRGIEVLGGELVRARSVRVAVVLQPAVRDAAVRALPVAPVTWASAAAASAAQSEEEPPEQLTPEAGDLVQHFAFGLCEVLQSDGDRLRIRDVEGPRRVREVALTMLGVTGPTESDGRRLFHLVRRGPT